MTPTQHNNEGCRLVHLQRKDFSERLVSLGIIGAQIMALRILLKHHGSMIPRDSMESLNWAPIEPLRQPMKIFQPSISGCGYGPLDIDIISTASVFLSFFQIFPSIVSSGSIFTQSIHNCTVIYRIIYDGLNRYCFQQIAPMLLKFKVTCCIYEPD